MNRLPINGRIILVDDNPDQVKPLMSYFSKNKIPFTYFDGKFENFPEEGFDDIRILFLDINLSGDGVPRHQDFRSLQQVVNSLISKVSHPYLLILWTRDPNVFDDFKNNFFKDDPLIDKCPIDILNLDKSKFFSYSGDILDGDIADLEEELCTKLDNYPELQCILNWEATVHKVTNEIASIFFPKFGEYQTWSEETKKMFTQFSKASLGKYFSNADRTTRINSAFEVIHQVFMDELETQFYKEEKKIALEDSGERIPPNYSINTKLLIETHNHIAVDYPGYLTLLNKNDKEKSRFFLTIIDHSILEKMVQEEHDSSSQDKKIAFEELSSGQQAKECSKYRKQNFLPYLKIAQLRIDPLCDYVQQKIQYSKCVEVLLIPASAYYLIDRRSEALYISPIFNYENQDVALVIDFRTLHTIPVVHSSEKIQVDEHQKLFRIRSSLLADVQSKFARHANRQGLLYLE